MGCRLRRRALPTTGPIYYACDCQSGAAAGCVAGDDANAGTSASAPVRSWSKIASLWREAAGQGTVALCRSGRWTVDSTTGQGYDKWSNLACSPSSPCLMRDYRPTWASGSEGLPTIDPSGYTAVRLATATNAFAGNGFRFINLKMASATATGTGFDVWAGRYNDIEICGVTFDRLNLGIRAPRAGTPTA